MCQHNSMIMQVIMHRSEILTNSHYTDSANNLISATVEYSDLCLIKWLDVTLRVKTTPAFGYSVTYILTDYYVKGTGIFPSSTSPQHLKLRCNYTKVSKHYAIKTFNLTQVKCQVILLSCRYGTMTLVFFFKGWEGAKVIRCWHW